MVETDHHIDEDEVLRRMLNTPHEKHKPLREKRGKRSEVKDSHDRHSN